MATSSDAAQVEGTPTSGAASLDESGKPRLSPIAIDPTRFDAAVFDLDGVLTETAEVHAQAWKQLFDEFLAGEAAASGKVFQPFDINSDYRAYVDGRPRGDGVRTFLAARGIALPEGQDGDPSDALTVRGLGARKDAYFLERLAQSGVKVFPDARPLLANLRAAGLKTALVSSSWNAKAVLEAGGLTTLIEVVVDGVEAARLGLKGKPSPDTFLRAVQQLGAPAARAVGFEDALVGVEAIRTAGYGLVVGVDRVGQSRELVAHGADIAVTELLTLEVAAPRPAMAETRLALWPPVAPTEDADWLIVEDGFTFTREHEIESIFAISNGHLGSRASLVEGGPMSAPAIFVAGLFDAGPGSSVPALAALPDWSHLAPVIEGAPLSLRSGRLIAQRRTLDMRQGILWRDWSHEDPAGRVTHLQECRLASADDRRLLLQALALTPENYSGAIRFETGLDGSAEVHTSRGGVAVVSTASLCAATPDLEAQAVRLTDLTLPAQLAQTWRIDRFAAVDDSRPDPRAVAEAHAAAAQTRGMGDLIARHRAAWSARWEASDVRVDGDPEAQRALRFAAYHLLGAADPTDERVSIGARAMTGAAYSGHVFWDTEIYMLPFFALTWPEAARALLMYRHHTLATARAKAVRYGARGAFYAWESADTGEDVTPASVVGPGGVVIPIRLAVQEQHISADVAFGVWSYWRATGDDVFLVEAGAEIIIETARFWASRAEPGGDGKRHIRGVVGPDEYHEHVDDDAYTNGMARWNLRTAATVVHDMASRWPEPWAALRATLGFEDAEVDEWSAAARDLYTGLDPKTGLIEQFQGYFALKDLPVSSFVSRIIPVDVLLGLDRLMRLPIIKQPDVLMLIYLLWDEFTPEVREANFRYYEPRCAHGSSLSPCIHALLAARLGDMTLAKRYFRQASQIDLNDNMGNASGGVHVAALGGLWQAAVFGFAGLRLGEDGPQLDPKLPPEWRGLSFRIRWRGKDYTLNAQAQPPSVPARETA